MKLQAVKGTHDILPEAQASWRLVRNTAQRVLERAGAEAISPPVFEYSDVFVRSVGETSDLVVQKEMYTFSDRGGRDLTLRPEFTAGVVRAFIEHGMYVRPLPVKLWSFGPLFRAENVQRGRFRQFHQINYEAFGLDTPLIDAETIGLLYDLASDLGLKEMVVKLGSVGDPKDRRAYNAYLQGALAPQRDDLSEASQERLRLNPMRILDSKDAGDQRLLQGLKRPLDFLNPEARAHFDAVKTYLESWGIPVEVDHSIVRGLDYYRRTAFELHHGKIGAQSALCGGGRYDGLVEAMGGPAVPGVGWAVGVERLLDALTAEGALDTPQQRPLLYLVPMDERAVAEGAKLARTLKQHLPVRFGYQPRNPGKGLRDADRLGARFAALRGEKEREKGVYALKHLETGKQEELSEDGILDYLLTYLKETL